MIKKILYFMLIFTMVFALNVSAETTADTSEAPAVTEQMPMQGGRPGGGIRGPQGERPPMPGGEMMPQGSENTATETERLTPPAYSENTADTANGQNIDRPPGGGMGQMNGGWMPEAAQTEEQPAESKMNLSGFVKTYSTPITAVILLILAFVFVMFYKRRNY